jgi:hypothetical protein
MSIGNSGRLVLEDDPVLKRQLYSVLSAEGKTLKQWFVGQAQSYIRDTTSPQLNLLAGNSKAATR